MLAMSVAVAVLLGGCASQPDIYRANASGDGLTLEFEMGSCNGDYRVVVDEGSERVIVGITDQMRRSPFWGSDCDGVAGPVQLEQPLGDRVLLENRVQGIVTPVTYWPWNQTRYSEVEYLAALDAAAQCVEAAESEATVTVMTNEDGWPILDVELPDLADGQSGHDPSVSCVEQHVDPLLH